MKSLPKIGAKEWCSLPELNIPYIKAKIDTGATLCALHVSNVKLSKKGDQKYISFSVHPLSESSKTKINCKLPVHSVKTIKSSNGILDFRFVVELVINIGELSKKVLVTLADRSKMEYNFLLGSEALKSFAVVDVEREYIHGDYDDEFVFSHYKFNKDKKRKLKVALLASNPKLYSNKRIIQSFRDNGHEVDFINISKCHLKVQQGSYSILYKGETLPFYDVVIPRIKPSLTFFACSLLRQLRALGVYCVNEADSIRASRDKLLAYQILSQRGLPIPLTAFANSPKNTKHMIETVGGAPLVIKILESTQGKGVILAQNNKSAETSINAFKQLGANILIQEYIEESKGSDIRVFVIGNKVVGVVERRASDEDEFRSNIHLGGAAYPIKLPLEFKKLAVAAAKSMGLEIAGVDMVRSKDGVKILEVNSSPGLEGIEGCTKIDIGKKFVEYVETKLM